MRDWPKISIITASYNSEKFIEQTILSVLNQTYPHIEYIIVDGASTDGTMDIVHRYQSRIARIISESDEGIYDAFNKGVRVSTGDVIYFLNSDDYLYDTEVIGKVALAFHEHPETMVIYGRVLVWDPNLEIFQPVAVPADRDVLRRGRMPPHQGLFIRKTMFEKYGEFDLQYEICSDFDFLLRVMADEQNKAIPLNETIAVFRTGGVSTQLFNKKKLRQERAAVLQSHFGESVLPEMSQEEYNLHFIQKWFENLLIRKQAVSSYLLASKIRRVAVFGSQNTAVYAYHDLLWAGIEVAVFLDNDPQRHQYKIGGVPIRPPVWLKDHLAQIDAVILAFGGDYDREVRTQIGKIAGAHDLPCISWREMIVRSMDEMSRSGCKE